MSERTINENQKIWAAAEKIAEEAVAAKKAASEEERRKQKKRVVKLVLLMILIALIIVFASIAWFAMNSQIGAGGMGVTVNGQNFEVRNVSASKDGIFKDPYHDAVHEEGALYWKMTATNNLKNYNEYVDDDHPGDQGIHPGTEGVISFDVISKTDSVNLNFDFEIVGYRESTDDKGTEDTQDDTIVMTPLSQLSDGVTAQNLLNGHILLFEHRSGTEGNYVYSTPICSNAQMHRIMNRTVTDENESTRIDIYWVWPNTLSTLVDASASGVSTVPFCQDDDAYHCDSYTAVTGNIVSYPHYYLKGASSGDTITTSDIGAHYASYGDMYDQGDNEIGMRVNYTLIKLSVTEENAGGDGS
jgi:hypothetical protein